MTNDVAEKAGQGNAEKGGRSFRKVRDYAKSGERQTAQPMMLTDKQGFGKRRWQIKLTEKVGTLNSAFVDSFSDKLFVELIDSLTA